MGGFNGQLLLRAMILKLISMFMSWFDISTNLWTEGEDEVMVQTFKLVSVGKFRVFLFFDHFVLQFVAFLPIRSRFMMLAIFHLESCGLPTL